MIRFQRLMMSLSAITLISLVYFARSSYGPFGNPPRVPLWDSRFQAWDSLPDVLANDTFVKLSVKLDGKELVGAEVPIQLMYGPWKLNVISKISASRMRPEETLEHLIAVFDNPGVKWSLKDASGGWAHIYQRQRTLSPPLELKPGHAYKVRIYAKMINPGVIDDVTQEHPYRFIWVGSGSIQSGSSGSTEASPALENH